MSKHSPSTKARKNGYARLHKLKRLLIKLLYPKLIHQEFEIDAEHEFSAEFHKVGWKDYMIRHTPLLKRGGPATISPSKRRRSKKADRTATIR